MSTARQQARDEMNRRILELGGKQLAEVGAAALSVRALTRDLGISSSAVYRYVASRDELLTRLILDSYDSLGEAVETSVAVARAGASGQDDREPLERWRGACAALRAWALANPHRWMLIYGSPVPGYKAPEETLAPAGRVVTVLARLVSMAGAVPAAPRTEPPARLLAGLRSVGDDFGTDLEPSALLMVLSAFGRLVGILTLELGGHLVGTVEPTEDYWAWLVDELGSELGLTG